MYFALKKNSRGRNRASSQLAIINIKSKLEEFNYDHFLTNHSKNFVDEY